MSTIDKYFFNHAFTERLCILQEGFTLQLLEEVIAEDFGDKVNREPLHQGAGVEQVEQRSRLEVWKARVQDGLDFPEYRAGVGRKVAELSQGHDLPGHLAGAVVVCSVHKALCNSVEHRRGEDVSPAKELNHLGNRLWVGGEGNCGHIPLHRLHKVMIAVTKVHEGPKHDGELLVSEMRYMPHSLLAQIDHERHGLHLIQGHESTEQPADSSRIHAGGDCHSVGVHGIKQVPVFTVLNHTTLQKSINSNEIC